MVLLAFLLATLQSQLQAQVADSPSTGIIVGILDHGRLTVYKEGTAGNGRPIDEHTLFEIGSVTKTFTATILARMVLDGSARLNDPVVNYLPKDVKVPSWHGEPITLLELAEQRSGLPRLPTNMTGAAIADPYADYGSDKLYSFLNSYSLKRAPGSAWEYSNLGFGLLGQALSNRAGEPYEMLLKTFVLKPLGMTDTTITLSPAQASHLAIGHAEDGDPVAPWHFKALAGGGAIRSSLADMIKYLRCNMGEGPLAKACLYAQQPRAPMPGGRIGLAWWTNDVTHIINHGGDTAGYHSMVAISADRKRGVVVLSNGGEPVEEIGLLALDPSMKQPAADAVTVDAKTLDGYTGFYQTGEAPYVRFTVKRVGSKLFVKLTGQDFARVYPGEKPDEFFYRIVRAKIVFQRNGAQKIAALTLFQNGQAVQAFRSGVDAGSVKPLPKQTFAPVVSLDDATLSSYVGRYAADGGLVFTVTKDGEQISVQLTGQPSFPVFAESKDRFYYKVVEAEIEFKRDPFGKVTSLVLHQNGATIPAVKQ